MSGIADDLIVAGATEEEHDAAFTKLIETARKNNVGFNSSKLQFKQKKVNFYGHTITENGLVPAEDKLQAIKSIQTPPPECKGASNTPRHGELSEQVLSEVS